MGVANAAVLIPTAIVLTSRSGPEGAALALLITALGFLPLNYGVAAKFLGLTFGDIGRIFFRPAIATAVMYAAVWQLLDHLVTTDATLVVAAHLSAAIAVGVLSYAMSTLGLWVMAARPDGAETFALEWFHAKVQWLRSCATGRRAL